MLNMFRTLINITLTRNHPSLQNKTTDVVIHQHSRKLLMMDILMSEICWAHKKWNKIRSGIKLVFHSSNTVIPRLTKIIRSGITFVSRNVMLLDVSLLAVSNVNNPVGLVGLPYVMWSAHFFVIHIQTEKISSWNGPTVHVCCFMLARASTKTFVSRVRKTAKNIR